MEGADDARFFNSVFKPLFEEKYQTVEIKEYAHKKAQYVQNFLTSIDSMGDRYIFVHDFDSDTCVTNVKNTLRDTYTNLEDPNIEIVKDEIESWYASGLTQKDSKYLKSTYPNTESITKEMFDRLMPNSFSSKIDFTREILKRFSIDEARSRNNSFDHFFQKYLQ